MFPLYVFFTPSVRYELSSINKQTYPMMKNEITMHQSNNNWTTICLTLRSLLHPPFLEIIVNIAQR